MCEKPVQYIVRECRNFYVVERTYTEYVWGFWPARVIRNTVGVHDTEREAYEAILSGKYS